VPNFSLAADAHTSAAIRHSWQQPPEIWVGAAGHWQQVTHINREQRPAWGNPRSIHWHNEAFEVQGWLVYPADFDPGRRYPLIVCVHGGPAFVSKPGWPGFFDVIPLAGAGYFVFLPNPRGSYGQGRAFNRANIRDFGGADFRDIITGVDAVLKLAPIDPAHVGITGWSYGGYMSMWAVTQTDRFRAAVAGAGIANWQSYYGQNEIDQWMIPFFGASVYDDPAVYAKSSPINFIKRAKTPTLLLVGDRDSDCPAAQSYEFWHALKTLGVPAELVVYPGEAHSFVDPQNRRDAVLRTAEWLDRYLK
jgi:dipeptidyl aminopeptidase/acylaminoacyl peptidase